MKRTRFAKAISICGVIIIAGLTTVGATTVYQTVSATLRPDIVVRFKNDVIELKDSNGETITPMIVKGSTYMPIRTIANLTGLDVEWDEETQTIYFNEKDTTKVENEKIGIRGIVKDIVNGKDGITFLVEGKMASDTVYDIAYVTVNMESTVLKDGINITKVFGYTEIKEGDLVEVEFKGGVAKSYPVQGIAKTIKIMEVIDANSPVIQSRVKAPDVVGEILEVKEDGKLILVDSKDTNVNGKVWITITKETNFFENISEEIAIGYRNISRDFKVGNHVEIIIDGPVMESYPMQAAASAVTVNEKR